MQNEELQSMTVIQLRKLAKENGVKLSAGIDKEGIIARISGAIPLGDQETTAPAPKPASAKTEDTAALPKQEIPAESEKLQEAALSADVTSVRPGAGFQPWNHPPEQGDFQPPVYRQAWQARSTLPREPIQKPAWQQPQRPVGTVNRFGPQTTLHNAPAPLESMNNEGMERMDAPSASSEQARPIPDNAPKLDGYRLGYRAAPQRTSYQNRNDYGSREQNYGGYQQGGYRQSNAGGYQQRNTYQPQGGGYQPQQGGGYQPQGGSYQPQGGGFQQQNNFPQSGYRPSTGGSYSGYQQRSFQPPATENNFNDDLYRMARDPKFAEQAEAGQTPELLQVMEGEPASGVLEILPDGYGFLRGQTLLPGKKDIYVSMAQVRRYGLRTGDSIEGKARAQRDNDKFAALLCVEKVNGRDADESGERLSFEQLVPIYPDKRIALESAENQGSMAIRLVDLIAPIGYGQRAMIVAPPESGRLVLLKEISAAIKQNDAETEMLMLLIDIAPEEVTEIRESVNAEVFATTFADAPETQTRVSETMLERAQRLVEDGRNVVILLDSLTKLTRAYQAALVQGGRPMTNTVTPAALVRPKRFFGSARNTRDAGSLTVIATIAVGTGSRVDDIVFEEFKGTANMEVFLCTYQQNDPVYPMIDLQSSGTKKDDILLTEEQKEGLRSIRKVLGSTTNGEAVVQLIDMMKKTKCNADLLNRLQDWLVLWEKSGYLKR
ncbi:MAG: transcription termination factor Rho [Clostridia bacterium]